MSLLVMKFGGDSLSTPIKIKKIVSIIEKKQEQFSKIVVVVSAMGDTTDRLLRLAKEICPFPDKREQDMLITAGERISMSLLAIALFAKGMKAISFTGSQSGIITTNEHLNAKIIEVKPERILKHIEDKIVIVAGFQGISLEKEVTTLGRGGSDTTAVAIAGVLGAKVVEFYKDVEGIYDGDPKKNRNAKRFDSMSYEEALKVVRKGARVLNERALLLAKKKKVLLRVVSYKDSFLKGTLVGG